MCALCVCVLLSKTTDCRRRMRRRPRRRRNHFPKTHTQTRVVRVVVANTLAIVEFIELLMLVWNHWAIKIMCKLLSSALWPTSHCIMAQWPLQHCTHSPETCGERGERRKAQNDSLEFYPVSEHTLQMGLQLIHAHCAASAHNGSWP